MTSPISIINAIENFESQGTKGGELQEERAKAMDYYLGREFGNEVTGRSQVVSRDVADSVEWIKPGLLRIFTSGDDVVSFSPRNQEDIESAQQETDYVNYIITQKNNWFNCAYVWFTDALIQRNGYVKAYWDTKIETEKETYKGLTDDQMALILGDPEIEIIGHTEYEVPYSMPQPPMPMAPMPGAMQAAMPQMVKLHDIQVQKKVEYGCAKFVNLPPERVIVSTLHQAVDLGDVDFVEHWENKTISDLRKEGFDVPDDIGDETGGVPSDEEEQSRDRFNEDMTRDGETNDPSMRRVKARECWLRFDEDGDGIAELRHCVVVGKEILLNEEADLIPIACLTPRIMPHRHIGISVADAVMDIQLIKSTLQRGFLDNVYFSVNGRNAVDQTKVNLDDLLTSRPGGIVRTEGPPMNSIMPMVHQADFKSVLAGVQYFDGVREERTGSSKQSQQLSPDVLTKLPSGVAIAQLMSAGQALVELIARVFAEVGVKRLFQIVHAITLKNARYPEVVRLRNKWVTVDPRQWKTRSDMQISVGLGTGSKEQQIIGLEKLAAMELQLLPLGISTKKTVHHVLQKLTQAHGFKDVEAFWPSIEEMQAQPPQPNPQVQAEMAKLQLEAKKAQEQIALERQKVAAEIQLERERAAAEIQLEREKAAAELEQERAKAVQGVEVEREKAMLNAQTQKDMASIEANKVIAISDGERAKKITESELNKKLDFVLEQVNRPREKIPERDPKTNRIVRVIERVI